MRDVAREKRRQQDEHEAGDGDQAHRPRQQRAHAGIAACVQHRGVAGEDDDENQRRAGPDGVDGDEECDLPVSRRPEHPAGDRVVDESADAGDQAAAEKDQVLADQPVALDLGQALAEAQSRAGLHFALILSGALRG